MVDARQKEILFQYFQAFYHFVISCTIAHGIPYEYLHNYTDQLFIQRVAEETLPWGVILPYTMSTAYHCILYFYDPLSDQKVQTHHVVTVLFGTALFMYGYLGYGFLVLFINYVIDMSSFIRHRLKNVDESRVVVMMMTKIHHMVTLSLLGLSYIYNFTAIGMIVMYIHDVADVPMFVLRVIRKKQSKQSVAMVLVGAGVIFIWMYYRVYCFGKILYDTADELNLAWSFPSRHADLFVQSRLVPVACCVFGMTILWLFNVYWTSLVIFKAIREKICGYKMENKNE